MSDATSSKSKAVTLADVARLAGVSTATASYVLANRADVSISAATRARVVSAADDLRYRRNALAAALRGGAARQIALYSPHRPSGGFANIGFAFAELAGSGGLSTVLRIGGDEEFAPGQFDGVVVLGANGHPLPSRLLDGSVPSVEIGGTATGCQVHEDDFGGARRAVEHLLSLGHRRIGHYAGPQSSLAGQERLRGFLDAVHEAGLRMDATPVIHNDHDLSTALSAAVRPTAILAHCDRAATSVLRMARFAGLTVPGDLAVVAFDVEAMAESMEPSLTAVQVAPELVAGAALALLERQFAREQVPGQTLVPTELVVRASTVQG
ncbi:MAG TPA: LacI family DNA-binding transcriptional regulator [Fimbriimonadaceae bacterium]|nr:LacI family DNA-binding transcriptional regulator [Fimbriimonadaceae bacterium]